MNNNTGFKHSLRVKQTGFSYLAFLCALFLITAIGYAFYYSNVWYKHGDTTITNVVLPVMVRNLEPIKLGNAEVSYGDICQAATGDAVKVIGVSGEYILAEYSYRNGDMALPGRCPNHTLFFVTKKQFAAMYAAEEQERIRVSVEQRKRMIVEKFVLGNNKKNT
jgi:hypothetical protein